MTDEELNRWAAEFMEPESKFHGVKSCRGWWIGGERAKTPYKLASRSLDAAALVEAKVIETVGEAWLEDALKSVSTTSFIAFATARQRVMACVEAIRANERSTR